jgi:hypothetical protein
MKVSLIQHLFAYDIPGRLCYVAFPIIVLLIAFSTAEIHAAHLDDVRMWGYILVILVISIPIGLLVGGLFICFFLSPFYRAMVRVNGGPFDKGDRVYVISGPRKGQIAEVYSQWQRLQVRIELGEEAKKTFTDVYSTLNLMKIKDAEPAGGAYVSPAAGDPSAHP